MNGTTGNSDPLCVWRERLDARETEGLPLPVLLRVVPIDSASTEARTDRSWSAVRLDTAPKSSLQS